MILRRLRGTLSAASPRCRLSVRMWHRHSCLYPAAPAARKPITDNAAKPPLPPAPFPFRRRRRRILIRGVAYALRELLPLPEDVDVLPGGERIEFQKSECVVERIAVDELE